MFTEALFTTTKYGSNLSVYQQVKKMWYIHTHTMEYYWAIKNDAVLPFATT